MRARLRPGDVLLTVGAGDVTMLADEVLARLGRWCTGERADPPHAARGRAPARPKRPAGASAARPGPARRGPARRPRCSPRGPARRAGARAGAAALWVLAAVAVVALGVLLWTGPLLVVRGVQVEAVGGPALTRAQAAQVRARSEAPMRRPLARVDTAAVARRAEQVPFVADVTVVRGWPSTLRLQVRPRVPVAAVPTSTGMRLVDDQGVAYAQVASAPAGVPVVTVELSGSQGPARRSTPRCRCSSSCPSRCAARCAACAPTAGRRRCALRRRRDGGVGERADTARKARISPPCARTRRRSTTSARPTPPCSLTHPVPPPFPPPHPPPPAPASGHVWTKAPVPGPAGGRVWTKAPVPGPAVEGA